MQPVTDSTKPRTVACPACGKQTEWASKNVHRPFCSARCKGIDLGAWASESYRIAGTADNSRTLDNDSDH